MRACTTLLDPTSIENVLAASGGHKVETAIVQRVMVVVVDFERIVFCETGNYTVHANRYVLSADMRIPNRIDIVPLSVWLGLPFPLRQKFEHVVIDDRVFVRPDSVLARQSNQRHVSPEKKKGAQRRLS